jgi:hypothetical protein
MCGDKMAGYCNNYKIDKNKLYEQNAVLKPAVCVHHYSWKGDCWLVIKQR